MAKRKLPADTFEEWLAKQKGISRSKKLGKKFVPDSYEEWIDKKIKELVKKSTKARSSVRGKE